MMLLCNSQPTENKGLIRLLSKAITFAADLTFREMGLSAFVQLKQRLASIIVYRRQTVTEPGLAQQKQDVTSVYRSVPSKEGQATGGCPL